jgi:ubiquitin carboxyl-terminal hydrolase 9/24
MQALGP